MKQLLSAIPIVILLACLFGCDALGIERTWHQKCNWKAEDYFQDEKVIALCKAIEANDLVEMKRLIAAGANAKAIGKDKMTLLMWAYPENKPERMRILLESGADPNVYFESNHGEPNLFEIGSSVTHLAAGSQFSYFDDVFEFGGDPNLPSKARYNKDETPIFLVLWFGADKRHRIETLIKKGAEINLLRSTTPLFLAAGYLSDYDLVLFMIDLGADYRMYGYDQLTKMTHLLVKTEGKRVGMSTAQLASYDKLVKFLEDHGESMEEARQDHKRWYDLGQINNIQQMRVIYDKEIADRKERQKLGLEPKQLQPMK